MIFFFAKPLKNYSLFMPIFLIKLKGQLSYLNRKPSMIITWNWYYLETLDYSITLLMPCLLFGMIITCWKLPSAETIGCQN
jgi:hypothetical protein